MLSLIGLMRLMFRHILERVLRAILGNSTLWLQMPASYIREWLFAKHPSAVIASIWSNLSSLNVEMGRESLPFTLDF